MQKNILPSLFLHTNFSMENGKYIFYKMEATDYNENLLNSFKSILKKNETLYQSLIDLISPVLTIHWKRNLKKFLKEQMSEKSIILNVGSGNSRISDNVINIDIFPYANVDIVCDILELPFKDNSVDAIVNIAVLEHVPAPELVVKEIHRVLKKGGQVFSLIPFMQGFHASPHDYSRRTINGMKILYKDFEVVDLRNADGPTSGFLWIFQEWLAILLSLGIKPLYMVFHLIIMLLTFPLKFIDLLFIYHPKGSNISSAFTIIGKKA